MGLNNSSSTTRRRSGLQISTMAYTASICCVLLLSNTAEAFTPAYQTAIISLPKHDNIRSIRRAVPRYSTQLYNLFPKDEFERDDFLDDGDDEFDSEKYDPAVAAQIRKAKQLLNDAKKKQKEQELAAAQAAAAAANGLNDTAGANASPSKGGALPFLASKSFTSSATTTSQKIKSKTKTGEIIADGETMASLSKSEPWERRSLSQMFQKEKRTDFDGNVVEGEDEMDARLSDKEMMGIYNLRKQLQNDDFKKVFDSRNRFIGEVD